VKIDSPADSEKHLTRLRSELEDLLGQPDSGQLRTCSGCDVRCGCPAASLECCCACSAACRNAPAQLSSEGERYPVEHLVLPLVYGLASLRVVSPCWSCQGHEATVEGGTVKSPQVWFYSSSLGLVHLLGQFLAEAWTGKRLRHEWQVRTNPYSERNLPIFIIEPCMTVEEISQRDCLNDLQHDLHYLGKDFEPRLRDFAQRKLHKLATIDANGGR